jgi:hypothetical protein
VDVVLVFLLAYRDLVRRGLERAFEVTLDPG